MREAQSFRNRITVFSFLMTVLVIYVHAENLAFFLPEAVLDDFQARVSVAGVTGFRAALLAFADGDRMLSFFVIIEKVLSGIIGAAAVPGFFLISGYLFFRGTDHFWQRLPGKWARRLRSLLVPYLLWNGIYFLVYVVWQGTPVTLQNFAAALIDYKYNPVFWYMKQLLLLTLLAPVTWMLLTAARKSGAAAVLIWGAAFWLAANYRLLPIHIVNEDAYFYYLTGALFAVRAPALFEGAGERRQLNMAFLAGGLALFGALLLLPLFYARGILYPVLLFRLCLPLAVFFGLAALRIPRCDSSSALPGVFHISFFVYAVHYLEVKAVNYLLAFLFPGESAVFFFAYLLLPLISIAGAYVMTCLMRRCAPGIYSTLTGGR